MSSLYSPVGWFSWEDAAVLFEEAKRNPDLMKGFINTVLGEPYEESSEAPEWQRLYERRQIFSQSIVLKEGLFLTAGVDVQKDHIVRLGINHQHHKLSCQSLQKGFTLRSNPS